MSAGPNELKITKTSAAGGGVETVTGLTSIGANDYNTPVGEILSVSIGTGITDVYGNSFKDATALNSVTFEGTSDVQRFGYQAFLNTNLSTITIPASMLIIGNSSLRSISSLTSVVFESGSQLHTIDESAFKFSGLPTITIPASVTSIKRYAFSSCSSLTGVVFESGSQLGNIEYSAFSQSGLTTITIPASVTSIGDLAFNSCSSLTGIVFESASQLSTFGGSAFLSSGLTSLTIPQSLLTVFGVSEGSGQTVGSKSGVTVILLDNTIPVITSGATGTTLITETGAGQTVYTINATDNVAVTSYAIGGADSGALSVNSSTGVVTLTGNPVEETKNRYNFTVTASDAAGNTSTPQSVSFIVSPACFPAGTPVLTDQGEVAIEKIDPKKHTIRGNNIEEVTKSIGIEDFLVCIKKDTLYPNVPSQDTYVTCDHKIFFKDTLYRAGFLEARANKSGNPDLMNNICQVPYNGEVLYNVLLKDNKHDYMCVNKMIVETMDPKNIFAKYYCYLKNKKQNEKNNKIEKEYEQYISNCYSLVKKHKRSRLTQK